MNAIAPIASPDRALEMLVEWKPSLTGHAAFWSGLDVETRTVRVMGAGAWHQPEADLYLVQQQAIVQEARRRFGTIKVLFDVRDWVVENPQSAIQFQSANSKIFLAEDRLAAVVASSFSKRHPRVALCVGVCQVFLSMDAAEMWLQAYSTNSFPG